MREPTRRKRRWKVSPDEARRHYAYAFCTGAEYRAVQGEAERARLSVSDYVRRCINAMWLEEGLDLPMLQERRRAKDGELR